MSLPFIPGAYTSPKASYGKKTTFGFKNGLKVDLMAPADAELTDEELFKLNNSTLQYADRAQKSTVPALPAIAPAFVAFDKKVLMFKAFFKQTIPESQLENHRVRYLKLFYYLEDDSISVVEPEIENSGIPQGKFIKRHRIPKDHEGNIWTWKDLNLGVDVTFYGKVIHIYDCDQFTRKFMEREGILLNPVEEPPVDGYTLTRNHVDHQQNTYSTPSDFDKLMHFRQFDKKVLRFYCLWDDRHNMFGELRKNILLYYLVDDTIEVREVHEANEGRDPFPILVRRQKIPRNPDHVSDDFPSIVLEKGPSELADTLTPADLSLGKTIFILGRPFLLYDCDDFTKDFYRHNFGISDFAPIDVDLPRHEIPRPELPPSTGYGSHEDSLQSVKYVVPRRLKTNYIRYLENTNKVLRYSARMLSSRKEDEVRRFIIIYHLSTDNISIQEVAGRNAGVRGGKFLEAMKIRRPESSIDMPEFYDQQDLYVGAQLNLNGYFFEIIDADQFVLSYMESHPDEYHPDIIQRMREALGPKAN